MTANGKAKKPAKSHRWLRWLAVFVWGLLALLVAARAYVFGWTWGSPPECHGSWSAGQCADLRAMDEELRHNRILAAVPAISWNEEMSHPLVPMLNACFGSGNILSVALNYKEFAAPAREALHIAMETGDGGVLTRRGEPLAAWALRLERFDLFRELVKRGADVNAEYQSLMPTVSSLTRTLAIEVLSAEYIPEYSKARDRRVQPEVHLQLLDWLGECKPALDRPHLEQSVEDAILLGIMGGTPQAAQWALRHGYKASPDCRHLVCSMLCQKNQPEALRELLKEPLMRSDTCYSGESCTTLQYLFTLSKLPLRDMLELARILLDAECDPNFVLPPTGETWQDSPLRMALGQVVDRQPHEQGEAVALIRLLVERGALLRPGETLPDNLPEVVRAVL